jgi:hypothetical protein
MKTLVTASALLLCSVAHAHNCPNEMKAIDAKLSTNPGLSMTDMDKVKSLRSQGEKMHKEGKHDESMKALGDAKKLLGL